MAEKKGFGETVLGWFVVREEDAEQEPAPDEDGRGARRPSAPGAAGRPPATPGKAASGTAVAASKPLPAAAGRPAPPPVRREAGEVPRVPAGATLDAKTLAQVYRSAEISDAEQERVEKALSLVQSLPAESPRELKKQIVEASMKAFGIPVDEIIEAGVQEIQALDGFIKHGEQHTLSVLSDARAQVARLEGEIAEIQQLMDLQVSTQQGLTRSSNEQKLRVQTVLEFFGQEAVARIVKASPKLTELK